MGMLNQEGLKLLKEFNLTEEEFVKPRIFGKPWKDHPVVMKNNQGKDYLSCAFCTKPAIDKVWFAGYTGVLVCHSHRKILELQNIYLFFYNVKDTLLYNLKGVKSICQK